MKKRCKLSVDESLGNNRICYHEHANNVECDGFENDIAFCPFWLNK